MPKPIKIPAGATHNEPSWRETLRKKEAEWKAAGGSRGYFQRALIAIMQWRGPSNRSPKVIGDATSLGSMHADRSNLSNRYIGAGFWVEQECATGQVLYVFIPDLTKQSAGSMFRRGHWLVQTDSSHRYTYAPATVIAVLRAGYPGSA